MYADGMTVDKYNRLMPPYKVDYCCVALPLVTFGFSGFLCIRVFGNTISKLQVTRYVHRDCKKVLGFVSLLIADV